MKILKSEQYINEKLNIKPVSKDRLDSFKESEVDDKTRRFIEDNNLVWNPLTKCYDCDNDVKISKDIVLDGKLKIRFGHVKGNFGCFDIKLTTLEGVPQKVGGNFDCSSNELTTLEYAPQEIGGDFYCSHNELTTLEGAPNEVGSGFDCSSNKLTNLKGSPQKVGSYFDCSSNKLTTLEGAPQEVEDYFDCDFNKLTNFKGAPQTVGSDLYCRYNQKLVLPKTKPSWIKGELITK